MSTWKAPRDYQEEERRRARQLRRRRVRRNRAILGVCCLAVIAFACVQLSGLLKGDGPDAAQSGASSSSASSFASSSAASSSASSAASSSVSSMPQEESTPAAVVDTGDWRLILVNNNVPLPDGYEVETQVADDNTGKELQAEAAEAYRKMDAAAAADGVDLMLCSGYRSVDYQTQLFEAEKQENLDKGCSEQEAYDLAKTVVAVPGCSEHNSGLAADIVTPSHQVLDSDFENTDAFAWLSQHAAEYGFILRYPKDKQAITGIIYEPWHYRYVGPENAAAIAQSGLCLEEVHGYTEQAGQ